jgi:hypothetical protein
VFLPNTTGKLARKLGTDLFAQQTYAPAVTVPCGIVKLATRVKPTPVRADYSATRGNAEEEVSISKILFPASVEISDDDKFTISGIDLRVTGVHERRSVFGVIDHYEVDFGLWQR